eukprot:672525-Lingulodinium_polyedra.AAC.1
MALTWPVGFLVPGQYLGGDGTTEKLKETVKHPWEGIGQFGLCGHHELTGGNPGVKNQRQSRAAETA